MILLQSPSGFRFKKCFSQEGFIVYCSGISSIMDTLGHDHKPEEWLLFIDFSKVSLQLVLLHNKNKFPAVPLPHATNMKETYENMKLILGKIQCRIYVELMELMWRS